MSWAAHNPEKYEEICAEGVGMKLEKVYKSVWDKYPEPDFISNLVEAIQQEAPGVWNALVDLSYNEIGEAEWDYWGGMVDAARERGKYADKQERGDFEFHRRQDERERDRMEGSP